MIIDIIRYGVLLHVVSCTINVYREGWLDRVVQYHKKMFFEDVKRLPPVQIKATIAEAPPGYVDSKDWDFDSVVRLLTLMRESEAARPAYKQLRRMLRPSRRILMSIKDSYALFPSIHAENYYESSDEFVSDEKSEEKPPEELPLPPSSGSEEDITSDDRAIVIVNNPVEARLPSARISVKMLREIMIARAQAARIMPSTTLSTIEWKTMNHTSPQATSDGAVKGDGNDTAANGTTPEAVGGEDAGGEDADKTTVTEDGNLAVRMKVEKKGEETSKTRTTNNPQKTTRKGAKKIKRQGQSMKLGRGMKLRKKQIEAAVERRIPFRAVPSAHSLGADHPLRNGFGGGYYENYYRAKHHRPRKIKNLLEE